MVDLVFEEMLGKDQDSLTWEKWTMVEKEFDCEIFRKVKVPVCFQFLYYPKWFKLWSYQVKCQSKWSARSQAVVIDRWHLSDRIGVWANVIYTFRIVER